MRIRYEGLESAKLKNKFNIFRFWKFRAEAITGILAEKIVIELHREKNTEKYGGNDTNLNIIVSKPQTKR